METPGERMRRLRDAAGLSRSDLASAAGMSAQGIAALENGESKQPSFIAGVKMARALGVSPDELAGLAPYSVTRSDAEPSIGKLVEGSGRSVSTPPTIDRHQILAETVLLHSEALEKTVELLVTLAIASGLPEAAGAARDLLKQVGRE